MTLIAPTSPLLAQNDISGIYRSPWGSQLVLKSDSTFDYESFECYHTITSTGEWAYSDDTLRLSTTHRAGFDSIVSIEHSKIDLDGIRVTVTDLDLNSVYFIPLFAITNEGITTGQTDTLGYVDFELATIDSVQIGGNPVLSVSADKLGNNHIIITFLNIDFFDTENFDRRPFLVRGRKLFPVFVEGIDQKKYFKKE